MAKAKKQLEGYLNPFTMAVLPFFFLILIGLISSKSMTLHQKVFKTYLIFIFDLILLGGTVLYCVIKKGPLKKKRKYLLYFAAYFFFILFQYIVSFLSKEVIYDREYYLANYTFLIILSLFFYLYLDNLNDIKVGLLILQLFVAIIIIWSTAVSVEALLEVLREGKSFTRSIFRPKLSFGNTNYLAGYFIGLWPLSFLSAIIFMLSKKNGFKVMGIISLMLSLLGIVVIVGLTQSIGASLGLYVAVTAVVIPLSIFYFVKRDFLVRLVMIIGVLIFFIALPFVLLKAGPKLVEPISPRLVIKFNAADYYIKDRLNGWIPGLKLFQEHPVTGAGLGSVYAASFKYSSKYYHIYSKSNSFKHSHNEYVEILAESGLVGMAIFILLIGFVVGALIKNVLSGRYNRDYVLMSIGVAAGILGMLTHQVFSLTLRMSVTMSAFFSLIGIGLFLISHAKDALLEPESGNEEEERAAAPGLKGFLNGHIRAVPFYIMLGVLGVMLIGGFFFFKPLFVCENNIVKALNSGGRDSSLVSHYFDKAEKAMPGNPYFWNYRYRYNFESRLLGMLRRQGNIKDDYEQLEKVYKEIKSDLDTINSIIPDYQDVWSKYAWLYKIRSEYLYNYFRATGKFSIRRESDESKRKALSYYERSLAGNFLNESNHSDRLELLAYFKNREQFEPAVKEYLEATLLLEYGRKRRTIKENLVLDLAASGTSLRVEGKKHFINVDRAMVEQIIDSCYLPDNPNRVESVYRELVKRVIAELDQSRQG